MTGQPRIGIDLGGTKIEAIVLSAAGDMLQRERVPTPQGDYAGILAAIAALVDGLRLPNLPLGIGTPGSVSRVTGLIRNSNSTCLNGKPLADDIARVTGREVRLANDADCFALSETSDGAAAGAGNVFGVILGTGVGGGLCIDGKLVTGLNGVTGEWGHNPMPGDLPEQRACYCGRVNCVENWLSGPGFARSYLNETGDELSAQEIVQRGGEAAGRCLEQYCDQLARALAVVINIVDPEVIVLGGGMSNVERLYDDVPGRLLESVFSDRVETRVVPARYGDSSGVRGAAWLWN